MQISRLSRKIILAKNKGFIKDSEIEETLGHDGAIRAKDVHFRFIIRVKKENCINIEVPFFDSLYCLDFIYVVEDSFSNKVKFFHRNLVTCKPMFFLNFY